MAGPDDRAAGPGEFELIERLFAKLAGPGGLSLKDDAAILSPTVGYDLVLTKDAIAAGRHYLASDPSGDVARKLLRVNLSDLAAKGARPKAYLLACAWGEGVDYGWIEGFCAGLAEDQAAYQIELLGGDTIRVAGATVLSLTAIGEVPSAQMVRRAGARMGDDVYVTGTIGDAALGLLVATETLELDDAHSHALLARYRVPEPPVAFGKTLASFATAGVDVSDGLIADLTHLCDVSGVGAVIERSAVPFSPAVAAALSDDQALWANVLTGGDDYQILFTAHVESAADVAAAALRTGTRVTRIGKVGGPSVSIVDEGGRALDYPTKGFQHF